MGKNDVPFAGYGVGDHDVVDSIVIEIADSEIDRGGPNRVVARFVKSARTVA